MYNSDSQPGQFCPKGIFGNIWRHFWFASQPGLKDSTGVYWLGSGFMGGICHSEMLKLQLPVSQNLTVTGFPGGASGKQSTCQFRKHKRCVFNPWVEKIPWRRAEKPATIFLHEEFHGQRILAGYSPQGCKESYMTKAT